VDGKSSRAWQAGSCLLCAVLALKYGAPFEGTEFAGGRITGPVFGASQIGILLFVVALPIAFLFRRTSGAITVLASALCLPLYVYFAFPGPFRWLFGGEYTTLLRAGVVWDTWSIVGMLALAMTASLGLRGLLAPVQREAGTS
jgi:hypothetical protein